MHMNLLRPINIIAGERPLSIFETAVKPKEEDLQKVLVVSYKKSTMEPHLIKTN